MTKEFGQQFVEARKIRGISLEKASEETKIKMEYLAGIENGKYDFNLPDIYLRGFIKIYARYLKLDVDAAMANCPIEEFEVLHSKCVKKVAYNTLIANEKEREDGSDLGINDTIPFSRKFKQLVEKFKTVVQHGHFLKIISGLVIVVLISVVFSKAFFSKTEYAKVQSRRADRILDTANRSVLSLIPTGNVKVVVRSKVSGEKIFAGNLESGEVKKIVYSSPIQVFYDNGEFLLIKQANGEQLYPQPGRGGIEIK
ncbi:MAG: helix-turn-helix domain-containing protein [Puniceicoccales bacterium]|jgi:transcriptional regulator with XRE-family HTH domain|nr:helix-turn-helix domain-containing protein [Puniceicoccales bacterium]